MEKTLGFLHSFFQTVIIIIILFILKALLFILSSVEMKPESFSTVFKFSRAFTAVYSITWLSKPHSGGNFNFGLNRLSLISCDRKQRTTYKTRSLKNSKVLHYCNIAIFSKIEHYCNIAILFQILKYCNIAILTLTID